MAAVAAGYRKGLVSYGWSVPLLSSIETVFSPCRDSISSFLGSFQSGRAFPGKRGVWSGS